MVDSPSLPPALKVAAVVPAAGKGTRLGHAVPKQYIEVCGEALFVHSLRALLACPRFHPSINPPTATTQLRKEEEKGIRDCVQPLIKKNEHSLCVRQEGTKDDNSQCKTQKRDFTSRLTRTDLESLDGNSCLANNTASTSTQHDGNTRREDESCLVNSGLSRRNLVHAPVANRENRSLYEESIRSSADDSSSDPPRQTQSESPPLPVRGRKTLPCGPLSSNGDRLLDRVVVVVDDVVKVESLLRKAGLEEVEVVQSTGSSRHHSIWSGVRALAKGRGSRPEGGPPDVVVIHDGARPLVPHDTLLQVVVAAHRAGAAGAVRPLVSTVVRSDVKGRMVESLVRSLHRHTETPQAFKFDILMRSYQRCPEDEMLHGTECLALPLRLGVTPLLVEGTEDLWKVTHPEDIDKAREVLTKQGRTITVVLMSCERLEEPLATETALLDTRTFASNAMDGELSSTSTTTDGSHTPPADNDLLGRECDERRSEGTIHDSLFRRTAEECFMIKSCTSDTKKIDNCYGFQINDRNETVIDRLHEDIGIFMTHMPVCNTMKNITTSVMDTLQQNSRTCFIQNTIKVRETTTTILHIMCVDSTELIFCTLSEVAAAAPAFTNTLIFIFVITEKVRDVVNTIKISRVLEGACRGLSATVVLHVKRISAANCCLASKIFVSSSTTGSNPDITNPSGQRCLVNDDTETKGISTRLTSLVANLLSRHGPSLAGQVLVV